MLAEESGAGPATRAVLGGLRAGGVRGLFRRPAYAAPLLRALTRLKPSGLHEVRRASYTRIA